MAIFECGLSLPASVSVLTTIDPREFRISSFSCDILSGRVKTVCHPLTRPIPVYPLVGSTIIVVDFSNPFFSAFSIIFFAILSLKEPPRNKNSHLATISRVIPSLMGFYSIEP